jgi:hypothetical protein
MKQGIDYRVEKAYNLSNLEERALYWIAKGWEPLGGVVIDSHDWLYQTLIKRADDEFPSRVTQQP